MLTMCRSIMRPAGYSDSDREGEIVEDRGGILYEFGEKAKEEDPGIDMAGEEVTLDSDDMAGDEHVASGDSVVVDATLDSDDMEGDEQAGGKEGDAGGRTGPDDGGMTRGEQADKEGAAGGEQAGPTLTSSERGSGTSSESSSGGEGGQTPAVPGLMESSGGELAEDDGWSSAEGEDEQRQR